MRETHSLFHCNSSEICADAEHLSVQIPEELCRCRNSYVEQALIPLRMEDLLDDGHGYRNLVKESMDALLKEAKEKFKGYYTCSTPEHAELAYKKVHSALSLLSHHINLSVETSGNLGPL